MVPGKRYRDTSSIDYEKRARLAEAYGKVPDGKWLISVRTVEGIELRLVDAPEGFSKPTLSPIGIPEKVGRYHKVARRYRDGKDRHEVSRAQLSRAVKIVHVVANESESRGWKVTPSPGEVNDYGDSVWSGPSDGILTIEADGHEYGLRIVEEGVHPRGSWKKEVERYRYSNYWPGGGEKPDGPYDANATGKLKLELIDGSRYDHAGRQSSWADRQSWNLEDSLPHLFREIEGRVIESERIAEQRRIEAEARAEEERLAKEEQERSWFAHIGNARKKLLEETRAETLRKQSESWHETERLRNYCSAVEAQYGDLPETREWLTWAEQYIAALDPLKEPPVAPASADETIEALQGFMPEGWSAKGPEFEYSPQRGHHLPYRGWRNGF